MYQEVYLDVVFAANLVMDYVLLRLTGVLLMCQSTRRRSLLGACIGALVACVILIIPTDNFIPVTIFMQIVGGICMVKVGCDIRTKNMLCKAMVALYLTAFLCGGFWDVMSTDNSMTLKTFFFFSAVSYLVLSCCAAGYRFYRGKIQHIYQVTLTQGGERITISGLYDTGNMLMDPYQNKPVSIIEEETLKRLTPDMWKETLQPHYLRFQSIGNPDGVILAVTLEEMCIHIPKEELYFPHPVVAIAPENRSLGEDYQMILHKNLIS